MDTSMDDSDELESMWTRLCVETTDQAGEDVATPETAGGRPRCETCGRPAVACLCAHLPPEPTMTDGALIVLTHPNERKRALGTGWILPECFRRCAVVTKREPPRDLLRMFQERGKVASEENVGIVPLDVPVYLLYPAAHASDVDRVDPVADREALRAEAERDRARDPVATDGDAGENSNANVWSRSASATRELRKTREALRNCDYVLIALDSTWRQAREMAAAAMPLLPARTKMVKLPTTNANAPGLRRVRRDEAGSATGSASGSALGSEGGVTTAHDAMGDPACDADSPSYIMRVEPEFGCMLTAEACARAMCALEGKLAWKSKDTASASLRATVETLRAMARFQSAHDPAMRAGKNKDAGKGKFRQRIAASANLKPRA